MDWIKAHKVWSVIIVLIILGVIGSAGGGSKKTVSSSKPATKSSTAQTQATTQQSQQATKPSSQVMVFDVPSLVGKNIDEIRATLGDPIDGDKAEPTPLQRESGITQWDNQWDKNNVNLLVTFDDTTRKVVDFFVAFDDHDITMAQEPDILAAGNLKAVDSKYKVEFVKELKDPSKYTGAKVTEQ